MTSKPTPTNVRHHRPSPKDEAEVRRSFEEAERGEVLDPETSKAYLRWLETGEGSCPIEECQD